MGGASAGNCMSAWGEEAEVGMPALGLTPSRVPAYAVCSIAGAARTFTVVSTESALPQNRRRAALAGGLGRPAPLAPRVAMAPPSRASDASVVQPQSLP